MGRKKLKCWIIPEWDCHVEAEEVPLEVCKLCVKVRLRLFKREKYEGEMSGLRKNPLVSQPS